MADYANNMFHQLWLESSFKHKIRIGKHRLDCPEEELIQRYMASNGKYDGVHFYGVSGRVAYTNSVFNILNTCIPGQNQTLRLSEDTYHRYG